MLDDYGVEIESILYLCPIIIYYLQTGFFFMMFKNVSNL